MPRSHMKQEDKIISRIYTQYCTERQIDVMRIGDLMAMARAMLRAGAEHADIGAAMVAFILKG